MRFTKITVVFEGITNMLKKKILIMYTRIDIFHELLNVCNHGS